MISKLIIDGVDVELTQELPVSTSYAIADIRDPDKRNSSSTKTVNLYGTEKVNKLFEQIFQTNIELGTFNPNTKVTATYYINEFEQLTAYLQLLKLTIKPSGYVEYQCKLIGREGSYFIAMGESLLTDLSWTKFDHTYSKTEQQNTWATSYRLSGVATAFSIGAGYVYPYIKYGYTSSDTVTDVNHLKPAIALREYFLAIFQSIGYTWTSTFLDGSFFKHLYIPCNRDKIVISSAAVAASQYYVGTTNDTIASTNPTVGPIAVIPGTPNTVPYSNEGGSYFDTSNQHNSTGGTIGVVPAYCSQVAYSGTYAIVAKFDLSIKADASATYPVGKWQLANPAVQITIGISTDNGSTWSYPAVQYVTGTIGALTAFNTYASYGCPVTAQTPNIYMTVGTLIKVQWYIVTGDVNIYQDAAGTVPAANGTSTTVTLKFATGSGNEHYLLRTDTAVADGNTLTMNNAIPQNIKQKDLVKWVMQKFNLYSEIDKTNPTNLIIEPRDTFFTTTAVDMTHKIDLSKDIEVSPMGDLDFRTYVLKDKDDKDYYNDLYQKSYVDNYGLKREVVDNDFIRSEKKIETGFSPTPLVGNTSNNIICPKIYSNDGTVIKPIAHNIRLLYYGGLISSGNAWTYSSGVSGNTSHTTYPYIGHLDNPVTPTIDLNFWYPKEVYYNYLLAYMTSNNCYNAYYYRMINEITDQNSKIVKAFFRLDEKDIYNFTFRNPWFINDSNGGAYYIVNKIENYNPLEVKTTRVELLKLKTFAAASLTDLAAIDLGLDTATYTDVGIRFSTESNANSNRASGNALALGNGNNIEGDGNTAIASNNCTVPASATNISLIGCTNVLVNPLVTNFTGVGLSNVTITTASSNKTIIEPSAGTEIAQVLRTATKTATFSVDLSTDLYYIDCSGGSITANYDTTTYNYTGRTIQFLRTDSSANTFTIDDGSGLAPFSVNGNASPWNTGMVQYDNLPLIFNGTNFNIG